MSEAKKVYVVTDGDYSDYHICAVFDSEQAAQDYIAMRGRLDASFGGSVEPWILNAEAAMPPTVYSVAIDKNGAEVRRSSYIDWWGWHEGDEVETASSPRCDFAVYGQSTRGYDVALKIARDKLAETKAQEAGV